MFVTVEVHISEGTILDYNYETLLDERFQMLCQSLLVQEYEGVQCFPVGMPDGGRDATASDDFGPNGLVFQVKFCRHPEELKDPVKWVIDAIDGELDKIDQLINRGATKYILITNVRATSHLDSGRIDKVQRYLNTSVSVTSQCWWREDLDRRLDNNYSLKLRYPTLLSGIDLLRVVWEATGVGEERERRQSALNAYFADQYDEDAKIRFKQAELLPSPLFDLYIDVPMRPAVLRHKNFRHPYDYFYFAASERLLNHKVTEYQREWDGSTVRRSGSLVEEIPRATVMLGGAARTVGVGASDLLLDDAFLAEAPRIVLEGAPGQGKSTLAQYLAQIQRARILQRNDIPRSIPASHRSSPIMLPFKLELRDLASWLRGIDPWASHGKKAHHDKSASLEGALAAHIEKFSGGVPFDVGDFLKVVRSSPVLLILDALDEVADLDDRRQVVDEVDAAVLRLDQQAFSLRVLVTSRPTAIAGSPTLASDKFVQYTLAAIHEDIALDYAAKWARVRHLNQKDTRALQNTLQQKISAPHMAELAKNTMQLSILLSLIYLRGASLPDKRTELYDTYIDVFFSRESEKNEFVRNNRDMLLDIHLYLGFYLHAQAERNKDTGRIPTKQLEEVLLSYLKSENRPTEIVTELLTGVLERIVALVSRVQGTYEFEVQPLREYFAARYLYNTAPYSPQGRERRGTKPDRFEALAPNPYWLNVTRFFAGCFSKGELLDLAERICDLIKSERFKYSYYPRNLALSLLRDWVFAQSPRATTRLIEGIYDKQGLRWACAMVNDRAYAESAVSHRLSTNAGQRDLLDLVWPYITSEPATERRHGLCRLLSIQRYGRELLDLWKSELNNNSGSRRADWLKVGGNLGVLHQLTGQEVLDVLDLGNIEGREERLKAFSLGNGNFDLLSGEIAMTAMRAILNGEEVSGSGVAVSGYAGALTFYLNPVFWAIFGLRNGHIYRYTGASGRWDKSDNDLQHAQFGQAIHAIIEIIKSPTEPINRSLHTWNRVCDLLRSTVGKTLTEVELAVMSAGIKSASERGAGADALFNDDYPLPARVRNARRRASQLTWWEDQAHGISDEADACLWILSLLTWATPEVIAELVKTIDRHFTPLPAAMRDGLFVAATRAAAYAPNSRAKLKREVNVELVSDSTIALLIGRLPLHQMPLALMRLGRNASCAPAALSCIHYLTYNSSGRTGLSLSDEIELAKKCHAAEGLSVRVYALPRPWAPDTPSKRGSEWAQAVADDVWNLPDEWVSRAFLISLQKVPRAQAVLKIADRDQWFVE